MPRQQVIPMHDPSRLGRIEHVRDPRRLSLVLSPSPNDSDSYVTA